jgi:hypothetical protein
MGTRTQTLEPSTLQQEQRERREQREILHVVLTEYHQLLREVIETRVGNP